MSNKKKTTAKAKEPIKVRTKQLANGNQSIYLDYYKDGQRQYEFLKMYLVPETAANGKDVNDETMRRANAIKSKKVAELYDTAHGFKVNSGRSKMNLLEYVKHIAEQKKEKSGERGQCMGYIALIHHLKQYRGDKTTFKQVDKHFCIGFLEYLKTAKNANNGKLLNENTQAGYMKRLEAVLNMGIIDEVTNINPFKQIKKEDKPKKRFTEREYLTADEVKTLEKTPYDMLPSIKQAFLFCCFSGLRFSDVRALTWGKLQTDNEVTQIKFTQRKTKKLEYLPLPKEAVKYLPQREKQSDSDSVFKLPTGGYVNLHLKQWVALSGINKRVTFHVARHTFATLLLTAGAGIEVTSKMLGHSDIQTTQIYAKIIDKKKLEAANKLDSLMN